MSQQPTTNDEVTAYIKAEFERRDRLEAEARARGNLDTGETLRESAVHVLMNERGLSELDALKAIVHDPSLEQALAPAVQERQVRLSEQVQEAERQRFNESPEGRAIAAKAAADAAQARATQATQARALLELEGHDVSGLDDSQVLRAAGLEKSDKELAREQDLADASDLSKNLKAARAGDEAMNARFPHRLKEGADS